MEACNTQPTIEGLDRAAYAKIREAFDEGLPATSVCQGCGEERPKTEFGYSVRTKQLWLRCFDCVDKNVPLKQSPEQAAKRIEATLARQWKKSQEKREQLLADGMISPRKSCSACEKTLPHTEFGLYGNHLSRRCLACSAEDRPDAAVEKRREAIRVALKRQRGRCASCGKDVDETQSLRLRQSGLVECVLHPFLSPRTMYRRGRR